MKSYILDKVLDSGTTYRAESDKAFIIKQVGTTSTSQGVLMVAGANCLEIIQNIARCSPTTLEQYDVFDLGDLYIVVPPAKEFKFTGYSGSKLRIIGDIIELMPGEALPSSYMGRFAEQGRKYWSYLTGSYTPGSGNAWNAGVENTVVDKTAEAGVRYTLNSRFYADITGVTGGIAPGDWTIRLYLQGAPLDILDTTMADLGIDFWKANWYDGTNYYHKPFSLEDKPITVEPGRNFKATAINSSGANKSTSTSIVATYYIACVKELL